MFAAAAVPDEPVRAQPGTAAYRRVIAVLAAGGLANFSLIYFVQPLLPQFVSTFGVSPGDSGLALSVATAAMMLGLVLTGPISDRLGRVETMVVSLAVAGGCTMLGAVMPSWELFLATRVGAGLALAVFPAVALAYLRDGVEPAAHLSANAAYIAGTAMGGALGRLSPLPLSYLGGWQVAVLVLGAFSVIVGIGVAFRLPRVSAEKAPLRLRDLLGGALASFTDRTILALCTIGFINVSVFVCLYNAISLRLNAPPFALGNAEALVYFAYLLGILAPALFRTLALRRNRALVVLFGMVLLGISVGVSAVEQVVVIFAGLSLLTVAFMGTHSILSGWVVDRADRRGRSTSRASSAYLLTFYFGSTLAGTAGTQLWASYGWNGVTLFALALVAIAICLSSIGVGIARRGTAQ